MRKTPLTLTALLLGLLLIAKPAASPAAPATACLSTQPISCGAQVDGTTTSASNYINSYACGALEEGGPEVAYELALPETSLPVTVIATLSNLTSDLDLFLLSAEGCDSNNCLDQSTGTNDELVQADGLAGGSTVYLVVDGYAGAQGGYHLAVECSGPNALALSSLRGGPSFNSTTWLAGALGLALAILASLFRRAAHPEGHA